MQEHVGDEIAHPVHQNLRFHPKVSRGLEGLADVLDREFRGALHLGPPESHRRGAAYDLIDQAVSDDIVIYSGHFFCRGGWAVVSYCFMYYGKKKKCARVGPDELSEGRSKNTR